MRTGTRRWLLMVALGAPGTLAAPACSAPAPEDAEGRPADGSGSPPADTGSAPVTWDVAFDRLGPVPLDAALERARREAAVEIGPDAVRGCGYASVPEAGDGVRLMVVDGRVVRADVTVEGVRTTRGVAVGDPESRVRELYGDAALEERPHKYTDGLYLIASDPAGRPLRLVFEVEDGRVTRYRAGRLPEVEWVEGCG